MKKVRLKSWVETMLTVWTILDIGLIIVALYMQRMLELDL